MKRVSIRREAGLRRKTMLEMRLAGIDGRRGRYGGREAGVGEEYVVLMCWLLCRALLSVVHRRGGKRGAGQI